jgi:hypothetical protein
MQAYEFIDDHHLVTDVFGAWPSFHDAEVHRVVLDRTRRLMSGSCHPSVELLIHAWSMTSEITSAGHYKLEHQSLVHFLFEQVTDLQLDGLNHQNVLFGLNFSLPIGKEPDASLLGVELEYCYGLSGGFKAARARVLSVEPYAGG